MEAIITTYITATILNKFIVLLTAVLFFGFVYWFTFRVLSFFKNTKKVKIGNVEFSNLEEKKINYPKNHLECPNIASLFLLEELRDRYHEDKMEIADRYTINLEQMIVARTTIDSVLVDWGEEIKEDDIPYKRLILENIRNMVLNKVTEVLQENHLAEMSEEDFLKRTKQRADAISSIIFTSSLNNKIEEDMKGMLKYCIMDIIKKARDIQVNRNNKVEKIKREYKEKREKILKGEILEVCA